MKERAERRGQQGWAAGGWARYNSLGNQAEAGAVHPKCLLHSADIWREHPGSQALGIRDQDKHDLANSQTAEGQDVPLRPIRRITAAQSHAQRLAQSHRVCRCNKRLLFIPPSIQHSPLESVFRQVLDTTDPARKLRTRPGAKDVVEGKLNVCNGC